MRGCTQYLIKYALLEDPPDNCTMLTVSPMVMMMMMIVI